jgi:hypothetical protein
MFRKILLFLLSLVYITTFAQGPQTSINVQINASQTRPALLYLPNDYNSTTTQYPLLIFLHGAGEASNPANLSKIYNSSGAGGPAYFLAQGTWPTSGFVNPADGLTYKFIVVSPQAASWQFSPSELNYIINDLVADYRVNTNRIYLTGLSAGGELTIKYAAASGVTPTNLPAAIAPMSANIPDPTSPVQPWAANIVGSNIRTWGFGDDPGDVLGIHTRKLVDQIKAINIAMGRFTYMNTGHGSWNNWYTPTYKETIGGVQMNMYEWMLQYSRSSNQSPTVNAGSDQTITLPTSSVTVTATASDPDGTIASYSWTKISGGSATISSATTASTSITGLAAGSYVFRCTVTDNNGATASDDVSVTVNSGNQSPTVNAGADQTITLPTSSVTVSATASDPDGTISSYSWTKISGGSATITSAAAASTTITGLVAGAYVFRCTVTDNNGATASDDVNIQVNASGGTTKTMNVNLYANSDPYGNAAWNDWNVISSLSKSGNTYSDGSSSSINFVLSAQTDYRDNGAAYTGFTMCPDKVGRYTSFHDNTRTLTISGLDNTKLYELSFYASRINTAYSTVFTIGTSVVTVNVNNNKSVSATFSNMTPGSGSIVVTISNASGSAYNYLNGFKLVESSSGARIAQSANNIPVTLAPNPANSQVTISTGKAIDEIRVFDVTGRLRKQQRYNKANMVTLNVSDLRSGIYFVDIISGKDRIRRNLNIRK